MAHTPNQHHDNDTPINHRRQHREQRESSRSNQPTNAYPPRHNHDPYNNIYAWDDGQSSAPLPEIRESRSRNYGRTHESRGREPRPPIHERDIAANPHEINGRSFRRAPPISQRGYVGRDLEAYNEAEVEYISVESAGPPRAPPRSASPEVEYITVDWGSEWEPVLAEPARHQQYRHREPEPIPAEPARHQPRNPQPNDILSNPPTPPPQYSLDDPYRHRNRRFINEDSEHTAWPRGYKNHASPSRNHPPPPSGTARSASPVAVGRFVVPSRAPLGPSDSRALVARDPGVVARWGHERRSDEFEDEQYWENLGRLNRGRR